MRPERRGMTLLEALFSGTLLLVLLGCAYALIGPMLRASQLGSSLSDLRQMAALSLETIAHEVDETGAAGLHLYGTTLSVQRVDTIDGAGHSIWSRQVQLYACNARILRRVTVNPPDQGRPALWQPAEIGPLLSGSSTILCRDVEEFRVSGLSSSGLRPPLRVYLRLKREAQVFQLEQAMLPGLHNLH